MHCGFLYPGFTRMRRICDDDDDNDDDEDDDYQEKAINVTNILQTLTVSLCYQNNTRQQQRQRRPR